MYCLCHLLVCSCVWWQSLLTLYFHISGYTGNEIIVTAAVCPVIIIFYVSVIMLSVGLYRMSMRTRDSGISENTALHTRIKKRNNPQYSTLKQEEDNVWHCLLWPTFRLLTSSVYIMCIVCIHVQYLYLPSPWNTNWARYTFLQRVLKLHHAQPRYKRYWTGSSSLCTHTTHKCIYLWHTLTNAWRCLLSMVHHLYQTRLHTHTHLTGDRFFR